MELNISSQSPAGPSRLPVNGLELATVRHNVHYTASAWRRKVISMFLTVESAIISNICARH